MGLDLESRIGGTAVEPFHVSTYSWVVEWGLETG